MRTSFAIVSMLILSAPLDAQSSGSGRSRGDAVLRPALVAGSYDTAVELVSNSCGPVTVQPMPTTVKGGDTDSAVVLTHAGIAHQGTMDRKGAFQTSEIALGTGATTYRVAMRGKFASATNFSAVVTVRELNAGSEKCNYRVRWTGTRRE